MSSLTSDEKLTEQDIAQIEESATFTISPAKDEDISTLKTGADKWRFVLDRLAKYESRLELVEDSYFMLQQENTDMRQLLNDVANSLSSLQNDIKMIESNASYAAGTCRVLYKICKDAANGDGKIPYSFSDQGVQDWKRQQSASMSPMFNRPRDPPRTVVPTMFKGLNERKAAQVDAAVAPPRPAQPKQGPGIRGPTDVFPVNRYQPYRSNRNDE